MSLDVVAGLETCVYESENGSATAVIGYDRVDTELAIYRFRFKSNSIYPSLAGFKVTLPSDLLHTTMTDYTLTCNAGCTSTTVTATNSPTTELYFKDVFTAEVAAGTIIDISILGWTNPSTETVIDVTYEVGWGTSTYYQIDKFSN